MANRKSVNEPSQGVNASEHIVEAKLQFSRAVARRGSVALLERCESKTSSRSDARKLLKPLRGGVVADKVLENCEDVLAILHDALEQRAKLRLAHGFLIPLREN